MAKGDKRPSHSAGAASAPSEKRGRPADSSSTPPTSTSTTPPARLNPRHTSAAAVAQYASLFRSGAPFPHLHVSDLVPDAVLRAARAELLDPRVLYQRKRNDLYDFRQTDAVTRAKAGTAVAALRDCIYSREFRAWIEGITGVATSDTVDLSAACYDDASVLLCHDDDLASRRIAFIVYLVPEQWAAEDGGSLDLFGVDGAGMPDAVAARLVPQWNSIAFFEVSPVSFHQVAEVLSAAKGPRLSISGWFHGKAPGARPPMPVIPVPTFRVPPVLPAAAAASSSSSAVARHALPPAAYEGGPGTGIELSAWVNPMYLRGSVLAQMAGAYGRDASLSLPGFLRPDVYAEVVAAMEAQRWAHVGPPILHSYKRVEGEVSGAASAAASSSSSSASRFNGLLPDATARLRRFLTSRPLYDYIAAITSTSLDGVSAEVRCFAHGDYTLMSDPAYKAGVKAAKAGAIGVGGEGGAGAGAGVGAGAKKGDDRKEEVRPMVDAILCCTRSGPVDDDDEDGDGDGDEEAKGGAAAARGWADKAGGFVTYMTADDELLTVPPMPNSLSIVCR
jgi:prolyl 3-hydroxylase /prolyl 3,4-dihydroxylase